MNFESLKIGFKDYLKELNETSNTKEYNVSSSNASIFLYADEFKDYLAQEVGVDNSIFSKNINEILNMEFDGNKLVDPDNPQESIEVVPDDTNEDIENLPGDTESETESDLVDKEANLNDDSEADLEQNPLDEQELALGLLNELVNDPEFIEALDSNADGKLDEDEMTDFLSTIIGLDDDKENLSLNDIFSAVQNIADGNFELDEIKESNKLEDTKENDESDKIEDNIAQESPAVSNAPSSSYSPSGGYSGAYNNAASQQPASVEKTLENMSVAELEAQETAAKTELSTKQEELTKAQNGETETLISDKEAIDEAYDAYHETLEKADSELADKVDKQKELVEAKETEISDKEAEIFEMEQNITNLEANYNSLCSSYDALSSQLSEMKNMQNADGVSDEQKANIAQKISGLEAKVKEVQTQRDEAKNAYEKAKNEDLVELQAQKDVLVAALAELNTEMTALQKEVDEKCPEATELYEKYTQAKEKYETDKANAVSEAQKGVETAQTKVNEVQAALAAARTKEVQNEYSPSPFAEYDKTKGEALVEVAKSIWGNVTTPGQLCAGGVSKSLMNCGYFGRNMNADAYQCADVLAGWNDWTEVPVNYNGSDPNGISRDDLYSLPAGSIIVWSQYNGGPWGHVCIQDGNGNEISDFTSPLSTHYWDKGGKPRVFIPNSNNA